MSTSASAHATTKTNKEKKVNDDVETTNPPSKESGGASIEESFNNVYQLRKKHFPSNLSVSYSNSGPLMIVRGEDCYLYDHNNVQYLDTRNNVAHVGHSNRHVVQAVQKQVATLNTNTRYLHPSMVTLANRLLRLFPKQSKLGEENEGVVYFVNSGSEANDLALRLARGYTNSCHTIVLNNAYHGHTLSTLGISPYKYNKSNEISIQHEQGRSRTTTSNNFTVNDQDDNKNIIHHVPCPDMYRISSHLVGQPEEVITDYYVSKVKDVVNEISEQNGNKRLTMIMESGMSVAGVIIPPPTYLQKVIKIIHDAGGIFIADEVQTGFGRFGQTDSNDCRMWGFQYNNNGHQKKDNNDANTSNENSPFDDNTVVVPDIVTVGKPFGNGMPLAAVITTRTIAECMPVEYFNTFGGNPVCAAAGLAMLDELHIKQLSKNAHVVGKYFKEQLIQLCNQHKQQHDNDDNDNFKNTAIGDVRGCGLFIGIDFVNSSITKEPATIESSWICTRLKTHYKILTSLDGPYNNIMVIKPPIIFSKQDVNKFITALRNILLIDLPQAKRNGELNQTQHTPT